MTVPRKIPIHIQEKNTSPPIQETQALNAVATNQKLNISLSWWAQLEKSKLRHLTHTEKQTETGKYDERHYEKTAQKH